MSRTAVPMVGNLSKCILMVPRSHCSASPDVVQAFGVVVTSQGHQEDAGHDGWQSCKATSWSSISMEGPS